MAMHPETLAARVRRTGERGIGIAANGAQRDRAVRSCLLV
jgi:hypothetical protein